MRILCAPDKFKHACSAAQVARAMAEGARRAAPGAEVLELPLADGGEGTLDALRHAFPRVVPVVARDALQRPVPTVISLTADGSRALVESAQACGLWRLSQKELDPLTADTAGVGDMILAALDAGARQVFLGLGGSATSDGGAGMLTALGARLLESSGAPIPPGGVGLEQLCNVDTSSLRRASVTALCDIMSPLLGEHAAGPAYLTQKGADAADVRRLQSALEHFARVAGHAGATGLEPGSGAAGGLGFGVLLFGGRLEPGADTVLALAGFERQLAGVDIVLTGEGSYDGQTAHGKLIHAQAQACDKMGIPLIVLAGRVTAPPLPGVTAVYAIEDFRPSSLEETLPNLRALAERAVAEQKPPQ